MLQRRLRIGYSRAARLIDTMEQQGIIGPPTGGGGTRKVLQLDPASQGQENPTPMIYRPCKVEGLA